MQVCRQVQDVECQELFDKIPFLEDITTLRAPSLLENSLELIRLKKIPFQQNKEISPTTSSKAASITLSMATYTLSIATYILSWVTFTLSGAFSTLHWAFYLLSSSVSTILSSVTDILSSSTSTILSWANYTTSFTFIVILTTLSLVTSNPRLSIPLAFIILFVICLKLECGRRSKRRRLLYPCCCFS